MFCKKYLSDRTNATRTNESIIVAEGISRKVNICFTIKRFFVEVKVYQTFHEKSIECHVMLGLEGG